MGDNVVELDEVVIDLHADAAAVKACLGPALMTRSAGGIDHYLLLQSTADLHRPDSSQFQLPDIWPLLFIFCRLAQLATAATDQDRAGLKCQLLHPVHLLWAQCHL